MSGRIVWKSPFEQIQNSDKVAEYLKLNCCGSSRKGQLVALCWPLVNAYLHASCYSTAAATARREGQQIGRHHSCSGCS